MANLTAVHQARPSVTDKWEDVLHDRTINSGKIFKGSIVLVDIDTGKIEAAVTDEATKIVFGVAAESVNDSVTDQKVRVWLFGGIFTFKLASPAQANIGDLVYVNYATGDPATVSATAPTNQTGAVGVIVGFDNAAGTVRVDTRLAGTIAAGLEAT